jgi:hypothetical protein
MKFIFGLLIAFYYFILTECLRLQLDDYNELFRT